MKFRPEAEIWPMMSDDELRQLAKDIDEQGQLDAVSRFDGDILDGRNRFAAITRFCQRVKAVRYEDVSPSSPIAFVIGRNEKRRHLTESQRGLAGARALPFFEADAKERKAAGQKAGGKAGGRGRPKASAPIGAQAIRRAHDDAAVAFGTSSRNVQRGKFVINKGSEKLQQAVESGSLSLGKAEQIAKLYPNKKSQNEQVKKVAESKSVSRVKGLTGEYEWYTPRKYLDAAVEVMGDIDLDPASSSLAQKHVKAKRFYTLEKDGLVQPWSGRVFLNPPYAMPYIKQFVERMVKAITEKEVESAIMLTNNATDTEWFHALLGSCTSVCLTRGRIRFLEANNGEVTEKDSPTHGQAFFYFGKDAKKFSDVFCRYGTIIVVKKPAAGTTAE